MMKTEIDNCNYTKITKKIILVFYPVYHTFGYVFYKNVYQNGLCFELLCMNLTTD